MTAVITKGTLANSLFKWEELAGKELVISVGTYPDELGKGEHICVIGMDKRTTYTPLTTYHKGDLFK